VILGEEKAILDIIKAKGRGRVSIRIMLKVVMAIIEKITNVLQERLNAIPKKSISMMPRLIG